MSSRRSHGLTTKTERPATDKEANVPRYAHPLARTRRPLPWEPDDRARHDDRERRTAVDSRGPRLLADRARVGGERLSAHLRRLPAARRQARRPLRPQTT